MFALVSRSGGPSSAASGFGGSGCSQWVPRVVATHGVKVIQLACGLDHSALISEDGSLYTWGEGGFGALGHGSLASQRGPRRVEALADHSILAVACGVWHTACAGRRRDGNSVKDSPSLVFTWGSGGAGQLGTGKKDNAALPAPVVGELAACSVKQVACGAYHTLVLTEQGSLFAAGDAGLGRARLAFAPVMGAIAGKPVQQIACGECHSLAMEHGGRKVYSWGCGAGGRLGHGDEKDCDSPKLVSSLGRREVLSIMCGPECSAAICAAVRLTVDEKAAAARGADDAGWVVERGQPNPPAPLEQPLDAARGRLLGLIHGTDPPALRATRRGSLAAEWGLDGSSRWAIAAAPPPQPRLPLEPQHDNALAAELAEARAQLAAQSVLIASLQAELVAVRATDSQTAPENAGDDAESPSAALPPAQPPVLRRVRVDSVFDEPRAADWWSNRRAAAADPLEVGVAYPATPPLAA